MTKKTATEATTAATPDSVLSAQVPPPPLTKEEFVKIINFIKQRQAKENKFVEALEDLGDGEGYCFLFGSYEDKMIWLLDRMWLDDDKEYPEISYFCYEQQFGEKSNEYSIEWDDEDGTHTVSNHSPEELYDYLCSLWPARWEKHLASAKK